MAEKQPLVITISRQMGSGGAFIGQMLAKKLKMLYADREIIRQAARQLSSSEDVLIAREEKINSYWQSLIASLALVAPETYSLPVIIPRDEELFHAEAACINALAKDKSAVIIGRCGSHILCNHPNHIKIFLYADKSFRQSRIEKLYHLSEKDAEEMVRKSDAERSEYIFTFTGRVWNDCRQYSISIDTGQLGIDKSVELISNYVELSGN